MLLEINHFAHLTNSFLCILGKGKGAGARITLSPEELNSVVKYDRMTEHFQKVLEQLQRDYMTQLQVRTTSGERKNIGQSKQSWKDVQLIFFFFSKLHCNLYI